MNGTATNDAKPAALAPTPARAIGRTAWIVVQVALVTAAAVLLRTESPELRYVIGACGAAFVVVAHAPARARDALLLALSLCGGVWLVAREQAAVGHVERALVTAAVFVALLVLLALCVIAILRLPLPAKARAGLLASLAALLCWLRARGLVLADPQWRVLGALFMFRTIVYAYDALTAKKPERFLDGLNYFFLLPAFHFLLFPVVDYATFKRSRAPDVHATAQKGIASLALGIGELAVYRWLYHAVVVGPDEVRSAASFCRWFFPAYLMYTNVSGQFHVIVGLLQLHGWRLPESNRDWLLADSFTDFWRRINIYWKEFMVRVFWFPAYFRLRKRGELLALVVATAFVFVATTLLHGWQTFWLRGDFAVAPNDLVFWGALGLLVMAGVVREQGGAKKAAAARAGAARRFAARVGVWLAMTLLWSIWSSPSLSDWLATMTWWRRA